MQLTAKILVFYLLIGSFLPRTDFSQLQKLSNLVHHYQVHQQEAEMLGQIFSTRGFFWNHFVNPDGHQHGDNGQSHQNLPFHSASCGAPFLVQTLSYPNLEAVDLIPAILTACQCFVPSGITAALFRPPIS